MLILKIMINLKEVFNVQNGLLEKISSGRNIMVLAMDHALAYGAIRGLSDSKGLIKELSDTGIDGFLVSPAMARKYLSDPELSSKARIIPRVDYYLSRQSVPYPFDKEAYGLLTTAAEVKNMGAEAAIISLVFGYADSTTQVQNVTAVSNFADQCAREGLTLIVETVMWGSRVTPSEERDVQNIASIARIGAELGADIVKAPYFGTPEQYSLVIRECPVPVTILGGPRANSDDDVINTVRSGIEAGAKGIVFGRNIWQSENPKALTEKLLSVLNNVVVH
jgi:DhnA family fructose-bisphosphate aldolase class Ia